MNVYLDPSFKEELKELIVSTVREAIISVQKEQIDAVMELIWNHPMPRYKYDVSICEEPMTNAELFRKLREVVDK